MRIKKKEQSIGILGKVLNLFSTSKDSTYSCDYINQLSEHVLYNNTSGNNTSVSLIQASSNFKYLEIYYKNGDDQYSFVKVYQPNGKTVFGTVIRYTGSMEALMINSALFAISESTITISRNNQTNLYSDRANLTDGNMIYITRVVGYK